jgi:hypothetical protein
VRGDKVEEEEVQLAGCRSQFREVVLDFVQIELM